MSAEGLSRKAPKHKLVKQLTVKRTLSDVIANAGFSLCFPKLLRDSAKNVGVNNKRRIPLVRLLHNPRHAFDLRERPYSGIQKELLCQTRNTLATTYVVLV